MPNLVGIGNSQVPTNAMLGGFAYKNSVGEINIEKIKARTFDTAVDIVVYDTSKDSDGGAWRHRTQNTSWYNEGPSADRGARKEFPAVAVIVAETDIVTIYDGDDPNCPMWMVFRAGGVNGAAMIGRTNEDINSVNMLNGLMCVGKTVFGLHMINFIADRARFKEAGYDTPYLAPIGTNRNSGNDWLGFNVDNGDLVNDLVFETSMTVRPNAPIDVATGLPVPTIVVATNGGTSLIKDDGSVIDLNDGLGSTRPVRHAIIRGNDILHYNVNNGTIQQFFDAFSLTADSTDDVRYNYSVSGGHGVLENISAVLRNSGDGPFILTTINPKSFAAAAQSGMSIFVDGNDRTYTTDNNSIYDSSVAYVTSNYNTGYMFGDIRGALLSDTDETNINGSNYVSNHNFNSGITGWTIDLGGASGGSPGITVVSNKLRFQQGSSNSVWLSAYQDITTVVGKKYLLNIDIASSNTSANWRIYASGTKILGYPSYLNQGQHSATFVATSTSSRILIQQGGSASTVGEVNSISVHLLEVDRSLKDNYVEINGTIHKNPVATGAELVSYSNFSNSNYLLQPYTSDLNFTTSMSIMFWVKGWVSSDSLLHRGPGTTRNSKTSFHLYCTYDNKYRITFTTNGSSEQTFEINLTKNLIGWQHLCFTLKGGTVKGYLNGVQKTLSSTSFSGSIFSQATDQNGLWIGTGPVGGAADTASLALLKLSESVPTAEQVKQIYEDEKCLYHENAKCTLYGTSDDVKALAFDDTNDILHVGTSAGRSEFQGLERINNTTTAVTTAISASNGFVAEQ